MSAPPPDASVVGPALTALADDCGVATAYNDYRGRSHDVPAETVRSALAAMGVQAPDEDAARRAHAARARARRQRLISPSVVLRRNGRSALRAPVRVPGQASVAAHIELEDGSTRDLATTAPGLDRPPSDPAGLTSLPLPADLPVGYHRLTVTYGPQTGQAHLIIAPDRCPFPDQVTRAWGWMLQLYALRSEASWGMGDLGDLAALARWSGAELGAAFVLCNPLHAAAPVIPQEPSPYYPSSRRFADPLYLRVDAVAELALLDSADRDAVREAAASGQRLNRSDRIDRDVVFAVKQSALQRLFAVARRDVGRWEAFTAFRHRQGQPLEDYAGFCALVERHGLPYQQWPEPLRHPRSEAVRQARADLADRVTFHAWLQFLCAEQLAAAHAAARNAGMPIGVIHDLAVGVQPGGADAWALQDDLATTVTVGAPPDEFNQQGQDWQQPPPLPHRLLETGFAPFRDMLGSVLRHAGGIRIDHILGLFRLFWIPTGAPASAGTYVEYPAADLFAVLSLEAQRAGAMVIGEDLGTVGPGVRDVLARHGILGSRVLYFERADPGSADDEPTSPPARAAADYPRDALASVNTHDLPTAAGWWRSEQVRLRAELGLLAPVTTTEAEDKTAAAGRASVESALRDAGLLTADDEDVPARVDAMHAFLARTPCRLVAAALGDAVGDLRQPNLPGTVDEYPNWRLPLAEPTDGGHRPLLFEDVVGHPGVRRTVDALGAGRAYHAAGRARPPGSGTPASPDNNFV